MSRHHNTFEEYRNAVAPHLDEVIGSRRDAECEFAMTTHRRCGMLRVTLGAALVAVAVPVAAFGDAAFSAGPERMFLVSYTARQSQALELKCSQVANGNIDCKGVQLLVSKEREGECTVRQWPVHGLPMSRSGHGRWRALLPSRVCTSYSTVYALERQGEFRWQLTVESVKTGEPQNAVEEECSAASNSPARTVYVQDDRHNPKPVAMGCTTVWLTP